VKRSRSILCVLGVVFGLALAGVPTSAQQPAPATGTEQQQKKLQGPEVETIEETNARLRALAGAAAPAAEYRLGPGDLIKITVFDVPDLSPQLRIDPGGRISLPLIPEAIEAAGLTPEQLSTKIGELLRARGLVSHPQVSVLVIERTSQPITVIGAVVRPLVYQTPRPATLLEALSAAGGLADTAGNQVTITRRMPDGSTRQTTVDLRDLIDRADPAANIVLHGGEVVSVPRAGIVYVVGAVSRPGGFVIQNENQQLTVLKALALAGGTKENARPDQAVIIRRDGGASQETPIDIKKILARKAADVPLHANDILFIPDSAGRKALARAGEAALSMITGIAILRGAR
jgi:polysaccharide export outer membrane protein